jgi:hypothetical protein
MELVRFQNLVGSFRASAEAHRREVVLSTGHSLGGAVALLGGLEAIRMLQRNVTLPQIPVLIYTFGQPRPGNVAFAAYVASSAVVSPHALYRVVHRNDIVPHLPPLSMGGKSWLHSGQELWYDNQGNTTYKACVASGTAEDPTCSDSQIDLSIADHLLYLGIKTGCGAATFTEEEEDRLRMNLAKLRKNLKWQETIRMIQEEQKNKK